MEQKKNVLILGAGDLGCAVGAKYLEDKCKVLLCDTCAEALSKAKLVLNGAEFLQVKTANPGDVSASIDAAAEKLGKIDIFIHAVNNEEFVPFDKMNYENWRGIRRNSLDSAFLWGRGTAVKMAETGGGFIIYLLDSLCASQNADDAAHCAMQWGIKGFVRCMAVTFGHANITTNAVCTGALDTGEAYFRREKMAEYKGISEKEFRVQQVSEIPMGRLQCAGDVSELCSFLTSEGININGQALHVNGGTCFN